MHRVKIILPICAALEISLIGSVYAMGRRSNNQGNDQLYKYLNILFAAALGAGTSATVNTDNLTWKSMGGILQSLGTVGVSLVSAKLFLKPQQQPAIDAAPNP